MTKKAKAQDKAVLRIFLEEIRDAADRALKAGRLINGYEWEGTDELKPMYFRGVRLQKRPKKLFNVPGDACDEAKYGVYALVGRSGYLYEDGRPLSGIVEPLLDGLAKELDYTRLLRRLAKIGRSREEGAHRK